MSYIIARPDALVTHETIEGAREWADAKGRETHPFKVYEIREVEHICQSGPPAPTPHPPGTPAAGAVEEPIAVAA